MRKQASPVKLGFQIVGGIIATMLTLTLLFGTWFKTDTGYNYVVQNTWSGSVSVISSAGTHFKMPFFTTVYPYKQASTINLSGVRRGANVVANSDIGNFTRQLHASEVAFADTYTGDIAATFRFRLPTDEDQMLALHGEFRSFDNMVDSLLVQNAIDVLTVTATQYTGEEFFQGGVNRYKVQLADQLRNGLYETRRQQVIIEETEVAPVSTTNSDANTLQEVRRRVWKNIVLLDNDGQPLRQENPLARFGVDVTQVTLGKAWASEELDNLLDDKRARIGRRIAAIEQLATAEAEAQAVQQEEEIETVRQTQIAQRTKDLAVIEQQLQVEVAREIATRQIVEQEKTRNLAVIDKDRELAIAEANRDIQSASAEAAVFEAQAILSIGLAEAQVAEAQLRAKQEASDIYIAEIQLDIARVMYPALKDVTIDMPDFFAGGTGGDIPNSLDVFTTLGALEQLQARAEPVE